MERIQKGKEEFDRISIAVCDDDEEFIEQLESAVEQTLYAAGGTADIYKFKDGADVYKRQTWRYACLAPFLRASSRMELHMERP